MPGVGIFLSDQNSLTRLLNNALRRRGRIGRETLEKIVKSIKNVAACGSERGNSAVRSSGAKIGRSQHVAWAMEQLQILIIILQLGRPAIAHCAPASREMSVVVVNVHRS